MAKKKRVLISKYLNNVVSASSSSNTSVGPDPIPDGEEVRVTAFGGALQKTGKIEMQLRTQLSPEKWRTLRAVVGPGHAHYENFHPIEGDANGIATLRVVRTNDETNSENIYAWIEGVRLD